MSLGIAVVDEADLVLVRGKMWHFLRRCGVGVLNATRVATATSEVCRSRLHIGPCEVRASPESGEAGADQVVVEAVAPGWGADWNRFRTLLSGVEVDGARIRVAASSDEALVVPVTAALGLQMSHRQSEQARREAEQLNIRLERANLDLEVRGRALRRVNRDLEMISAAVAHDLKQPLHALGMYGAIVEKTGNAEVGEQIRAAVDRMSAMLDGLMHLARVGEADRASVTLLSDAVDDTLADLRHLVDARQARVTCRGDARLKIGAQHLRTVLGNLLTNALKYARDGVPPEVGIRVSAVAQKGCEGDAVQVTVRDNGRGFGTSYDNVTQLFSRLSRDQEIEGAGVGLALVQRVVSGYNGSLVIGNRTDGPGAEIHIRVDGVVLRPG